MGGGHRLAKRRLWHALSEADEGVDHLQSGRQPPRGPDPARPYEDREHGQVPRRRCGGCPDAGRRNRNLKSAGSLHMRGASFQIASAKRQSRSLHHAAASLSSGRPQPTASLKSHAGRVSGGRYSTSMPRSLRSSQSAGTRRPAALQDRSRGSRPEGQSSSCFRGLSRKSIISPFTPTYISSRRQRHSEDAFGDTLAYANREIVNSLKSREPRVPFQSRSGQQWSEGASNHQRRRRERRIRPRADFQRHSL